MITDTEASPVPGVAGGLFQRRASPLRRRRPADAAPSVERTLRELGAELEVQDRALLGRLVALGVAPEHAAAVEALPLVEVAWADGDVDAEERWRVLSTATAFGLELGRPAHAQVERWLAHRPAPALFACWYALAARRCTAVDPEAAARARRVLDGAREVAQSAGGLLGQGRISRRERTVLARIREALGRLVDPAPGT